MSDRKLQDPHLTLRCSFYDVRDVDHWQGMRNSEFWDCRAVLNNSRSIARVTDNLGERFAKPTGDVSDFGQGITTLRSS